MTLAAPVSPQAVAATWLAPAWGLAVWSAGALIFIEGGLYGIAAGLLAITLGLCQPHAPAMQTPRDPRLLWLTALMVLVVGLVALSAQLHARPLRVIDNSMRLLVLPWSAWVTWRIGLSWRWLWWGAAAGIVIAFGMACWQMDAGWLRAGGKGNPLVFANLLLVSLAMVLFVAPASRWRAVAMALLAVLAGVGIAFAGSRASLLIAWLLCVLAFVYAAGRQGVHRRGAWVVLSTALLALLVALTPRLHATLRWANVASDLSRFSQGDADSPLGARLQFLQLAWQSLREHPWQGVGVEGFGGVVRAWHGCQVQPPPGLCALGHAHNDLAEWAATLGLPGLLAISLVYGVPLAMFIRIIRRVGDAARAPAARAGVAVVAVYAACGLTQSMFAHAATASAYALFVGVLLGMAWREDARRIS